MKYTAAAVFALAYAQSVYGLTINTPQALVQCQPQLLSWSGGPSPFFPSVIPGGQPSAAALKTFDKTDAESLTWIVDIPAGTQVTIALKDGTGNTAFTDALMVQSSSDSSCLNGSASPAANTASASGVAGATTPGASTAAGSSTAVAGATTPAAGSSAAAASGSAGSASSARPTGSQAAAASARPTSGAVRSSISYGLAGVLAAVGAALV